VVSRTNVGCKLNLKRNLYVALLLLALPFNAQMASSHELIFSHIDGSPIHARGAKVLKELYDRLGIDVGFLELPGRRALKMSNNGETDGEILRIWDVGVTHQNLLRVPTPLLTLYGFAFTRSAPAIDSFQQLDKMLRIGIQRGVVWAENAVRHRKGVVRVTTATVSWPIS